MKIYEAKAIVAELNAEWHPTIKKLEALRIVAESHCRMPQAYFYEAIKYLLGVVENGG